MRKNSKKTFTAAEVEAIIHLREKGLTYLAISKQMDRTPGGVGSKIRKSKNPFRNPNYFHVEDQSNWLL